MQAEEIARYALAWLEERRDPENAASMSAYMKIGVRGDPNVMLGVKKPIAKELHRELKRRYPPADREALVAQVGALWAPHVREMKYAALEPARAFRKKLTTAELPFLERIIREGAWWDLVDAAAAWLVAPLYLRARSEVRPTLDRWRASEHLWLRRSVLLAHLGHRERTDSAALFADIEALAHEKDFFIRKAIGWVLREYSRTEPELVRDFLQSHRARLSGLSFREGTKQLVRAGLLTI